MNLVETYEREHDPQQQQPPREAGTKIDPKLSVSKERVVDSEKAMATRAFESNHSSLVETKSASDPGPPPDGGFTAWTQVALMHLVFFNTWGVANGFGVFQDYYTQAFPDSSTSAISWIGDLQVFFLFFLGVVSGRLTDGGYFRITFGIGVFLQLLGLFMTSLCKTYWQVMLAQGLCQGIGGGLTFCPALAILSQYFKDKRSIAVGFASVGSAVGGLVYPSMLNTLIYDDRIGFPWAIRISAFVMMATAVPGVIFFKPRLPHRESGPWVDWTALRDLPFVLFSLTFFFIFFGLYFGFFYMGTFARDHLGFSHPLYVVMVLNGVGALGRGLPPIAADLWVGPMNLLIPISFASSVIIYCWPAVTSAAGLYTFAVFYGIIAAVAQALLPGICTIMSPDPRRVGTRVGMILTLVSFGNLTGPAICGAIISRQRGSYLGAQMFSATILLLGAIFAVAARIAKVGSGLKVKV